MNLRFDKKTSLPSIYMDTPKSMIEDSYDDLYEFFIKEAVKKGIAIIKGCDDVGCSRHFKIIINK